MGGLLDKSLGILEMLMRHLNVSDSTLDHHSYTEPEKEKKGL